MNLAVGETYALDNIKATLDDDGYTPTKLVQTPGEFAQRGSIIDIYPFTGEEPVRLDFFDDELDQIKVLM